jgi:hypothetical protein
MADNGTNQSRPHAVQDTELQNVETRTEDIAMHEPDSKPWWRTPYMVRLNLLMVCTHKRQTELLHHSHD